MPDSKLVDLDAASALDGTELLYAVQGGQDVKVLASKLNHSIAIRTEASDYTIAETDYTILLDGTSNTVTATLPTAVGIKGKIYNIKCIDDTNACDVATTEEIDGDGANFGLLKDESITIQSDNEKWWIL